MGKTSINIYDALNSLSPEGVDRAVSMCGAAKIDRETGDSIRDKVFDKLRAEGSLPARTVRKRKTFRKWQVIAACLCLAVVLTSVTLVTASAIRKSLYKAANPGKDKVIAVVNGIDIYQSRVDIQMSFHDAMTYEEAFENTVKVFLINAEAEKRGITASDEEIEKARKGVIDTFISFGDNNEAFQYIYDYCSEAGIEPLDYYYLEETTLTLRSVILSNKLFRILASENGIEDDPEAYSRFIDEYKDNLYKNADIKYIR